MLTLEINGYPYTNFNDVRVTKSIRELSGSFTFTANNDPKNNELFEIYTGDACRVLVDDKPIITGYIDIIEVEYSIDKHNIIIQGRDKTSDIIDSTVDGSLSFTENISLKAVIELILSKSNIDIDVIDNVGTLEDFSSSEVISSTVGDTVFDIINAYAKKRQVLLTSNEDGNIVITRGEGIETNATLNLTKNSNGFNNIKSGRVVRDSTKQFYNYTYKSQNNPTGLDFGDSAGANNATNESGYTINTAIRNSRSCIKVSEVPSTSDKCKQRAEWQNDYDTALSLIYEVTVQGHSNNANSIWKPRQYVEVNDYLANFYGFMLVDSVEYTQDLNSGSETRIKLVRANSYILQLQEEQTPVQSTNAKSGINWQKYLS